ncbi:MAG: hypothetical protein AB7U63_17950, partial [Porticoccaceae bacterium]
ARLPFVISVGDGPDRYHVVHAELMTGHPELSDRFFVQQRTQEKPAPSRILTDADLDTRPEEILRPMLNAMVWGRRVFKASKPSQARVVESPAGRLLMKPKALARRSVVDLCRAYTSESIAAACIAFFPGSWSI